MHSPSPSQQEAIEAPLGPQLVLAGPGAGKTFCLIERIGYMVERHGIDPARICAFTFTNKAAGEIAHRLEGRLGVRAEKIKRGTIHAFCAELLRELGTQLLLDSGFGIADEEYQLAALRRIEGPRKWHRNTLTRFSAHRFRGEPLQHNDQILFWQYEKFLSQRRVVDFDMLVIKAAELLERPDGAADVRSRWDALLVDEFQDLNPVQYRIVKALARDHQRVFAVGDNEQSIYSWAGADPKLFEVFLNDFKLVKPIQLQENRRCPRDVFALARKLMLGNTPLFASRVEPRADRDSTFPVTTAGFDTDDDERAWIVEDVRRDHDANKLAWGRVALLYRANKTGEALEAAFLNAGIPCRLAQGRSLAEDPVVAYVIAALRVISSPRDDVFRDEFLGAMLSKPQLDEIRAQAQASGNDLRAQMRLMARSLPKADAAGRRIRRALYVWKNLEAIGKNQETLPSLINELLSTRVGKIRSVLDDRHDEISDPAGLPDVGALAATLRDARERRATIWIPRMRGVEIALKGILAAIDLKDVQLGGTPPDGTVRIEGNETPSCGIALGLFKAAQLVEIGELASRFDSFTAVDLETTDRDTKTSEIVEIAAVRVRDGEVVDQFHSLVKPRVPIAAAATETHTLSAADLETSPYFEQVWPEFRRFCGEDVIVAHNGYEFDFPIISRMAKALGEKFDLCTYDTLPLARDLFPTSRRLEHLAKQFDIPTGQSHRALDDTIALAKVFLKLEEAKASRARKTALVTVLDFLGIALSMSDEKSLTDEARMFKGMARPFALGRYTSCLEWYEREQGDDDSIPSADEVIIALGGVDLMLRIRAEKTPAQRYPVAMLRLQRLLDKIPGGPLPEQIALFLERSMLSRWDGYEPDDARVQLLTLHSTKGLEFSRVYVVGAEDAQLPGGSPTKPASNDEVEESRRLLYVGMTRTQDRLVLTRSAVRLGKPTGGHRFLDEMSLSPAPPEPGRAE